MSSHKISLPGFKDLVEALEEIAKGRYLSSCFEKKAKAYSGQVLIAQEALEKFKANMLRWTNGELPVGQSRGDSGMERPK